MAPAFGDPNMPPIPSPPFNRLRGPEERGRGKGKVKFERFLRVEFSGNAHSRGPNSAISGVCGYERAKPSGMFSLMSAIETSW